MIQTFRVKGKILLFTFILSTSLLYSQEIKLPQVVTYIPTPLENKITYTEEEIQQKNLQGLPQLLQTAGIQLLSYGPYGLEQKPSIRGFTDETVRVLIDGICVNNPQTGTFDFSTINLNSIEKIEITKGGFTEGTDDEDAGGGVIYITTKKQVIESTLSTNTDITTYFKSETPVDTVSQSINFSTPITDRLFFNTNAKATFAQNNFRENPADVHDAQSNLQLTDYFGNGNSITLSDIFYAGYKKIPGPLYSRNNGTQKDYNNNLSLSLFTPALSPFFTLKNSLFWLSNTRFYSDQAENSHHYINSLKYNLTVDFLSFKNIKEITGFTLDYTNLDSSNDCKHNQFSGVLKETTKITLSPIFSLSIPIAIKFMSSNTGFTPKAAISVNLEPINITLSAYRMLQFPTMDDLYWQGIGYHGNPDLTPEDGLGTDFSVSLKKTNFYISSTMFANYYQNKIQWAPNENNIWMPQNLASAFYLGVDFSSSISLFSSMLCFEFQGEYLYTRLLDKSNEMPYGKKIMWTPDFTASLTTTLNLDFLRLILTANYTGKRYISNLNLSYLKPYILLNISTEFTKTKYVYPYISINNLLNTKYQSIDNYPMPEISITLGIKSKITYNQ